MKNVSVGFATLLLCLSAMVFLANNWRSEQRIESISVDGTNLLTRDDVVQLAGIPLLAGMEEINLAEVRNRILRNSLVEDVVVSRQLPVSIKIEVTEREPIAVANGNPNLYIDRHGVLVLFDKAGAVLDVPLVSGIPAAKLPRPGGRIGEPAIGEVLSILHSARLMNDDLLRSISELQIRPDGEIILYATEGGVPIIFGKGEAPDKLGRLLLFWKEVMRDKNAGALQYIDLRFHDQVVVRWNSEQS